jgi:hypothetical protein
MDALETTDTERVVIRGMTPSSPFTVRGDGDDSGDMFVIMPMHLGEAPRVEPAPAPAQNSAAESGQ